MNIYTRDKKSTKLSHKVVIGQIKFSFEKYYPPSDKSCGVHIPISHGGHGHDHAVNTFKVGKALLVVKVWRVSIILNKVDKPCSSPPDGHKHGNKLQKPAN